MPQIAFGVGENKNIVKACRSFKRFNRNYRLKLIDNESDLINCFKDENYDAVIRGSLPSNKIIKEIKSIYTSSKIQRATYVHGDGKQFLLSPVGIDEGNNLEEKFELAINCADFIKKLGKKPKIAILANGRKGDYGRSPEIDSSIDEAEALYSLLKEKTNYEVKNYYILIEQAIEEEVNVIIAPDGIIGNIIFRSLILINKWPSYGAVTFGTEKPYIDTSRDQVEEVYLRSLELAKLLIEGYKISIKSPNEVRILPEEKIDSYGVHKRLRYLCQLKKVLLSCDDVDYCLNSGDKKAKLIFSKYKSDSTALKVLVGNRLNSLKLIIPNYGIIKDTCKKYHYPFKHYENTVELYKEDLTILECLTLLTIINRADYFDDDGFFELCIYKGIVFELLDKIEKQITRTNIKKLKNSNQLYYSRFNKQ